MMLKTQNLKQRINLALVAMLCLFGTTTFAQDCNAVDGGNVTFDNGNTETTIVVDGMADVLAFASTVDAMANNHEFTYVITDVDGTILGIPPGNATDFDPAGLGLCRVWGLSYTGNLTIAPDDNLLGGQDLSDECFNLSSNHLRVSRVAAQATNNRIFVSSNNAGEVGIFDILADGSVLQNAAAVMAEDADGIFYDESTDVMYQLNRSLNVVQAYSNASTNPTLSATSTSDFINGREIAVVGDKLVVAQDATAANGDQNKLVVYTITPNAIVLDKTHDVSINLWGIHANGNQLFAIVDNSNEVARFDNFFNQPLGALEPTATIAVEGLVRTHGLTYVPSKDMMFLTDIGSAGDDKDGALLRIKKWSDASADGVVSMSEQIRVEGGSSLLGNPVDVAYDEATDMVYIAERARDGGRLLGFKNPALTGGIAPAFKRLMPGASALHISGTEVALELCDFVFGGTVSLTDGNTETTIIVDGNPDVLTFQSSLGAVPVGHEFTYVITDAAGMILGIPPVNFNDFDPAGVGACNVYGLSYTGSLTIAPGDNLLGGQDLSDECFDLSSNRIVVNRIAPVAVDASFYVSSNNSGVIGVYDVNSDGTIVQTTVDSEAMDADGIYYDEANDVLYQLNRTDNVVNAYSTFSTLPTLSATSTSDFSNGREIAVSGDKLIVAQDANAGNGDQNKLAIYTISPTAITLDKVLNVDINLWGIHLNSNQLFAIVDNSSDVAVFENIFNQTDGATIAPNMTVTIENMIRTHGLTYVAASDMMLLTDVGAASLAGDGAIVKVSNWSTASADGTVDAAEQIRLAGGTSLLGNPVDIAYDNMNNTIYVAERANGGGRVLGFVNPVASGGAAPFYNNVFAGASAIHFPGTEVMLDPCDVVEAGTVSFTDGNTETTIVIDGQDDLLSFNSSVTPAGFDFTYVVTDADGMILGIPPGNEVNFDPAGLGACLVYSVAYTGNLTIAPGDNINSTMSYSDDCSSLSSNRLTVNRVAASNTSAQFFVSSNNQSQIGVLNVLEDGNVTTNSFASTAADADGIYYDAASDVIYQLNRTDNRINKYADVNASLINGNAPMNISSSTGDFSNGREIAVNGGKLVAAQDANAGNGDANKFFIYDIGTTAITLDKVYDADINLWGIHANGDQMFAIVDNSNEVAVYEDFFNQPEGAITASAIVAVEGLIRTHGITYDAADDFMILTDVGAASKAGDGALITIENWTAASADGMISMDEQVRVAGGTSLLGNPVDVAYDKTNEMIYVAERANGGGRVLGFRTPNASGGIAPVFNMLYPGASAINGLNNNVNVFPCADIAGGTVQFDDGTTFQAITVNDGIDDFFNFESDVDAAASGYSQTFVITDADDMVLGIPGGNTANFEGAGVGTCKVYNVSYVGDLVLMAGDNLMTDEISTVCAAISTNNLTVERTEGFSGEIADRTTLAEFATAVQVYPVPAVNNITVLVESTKAVDGSLRIFNATGALMTVQNVQLIAGQNKFLVDVAAYGNGMYFIQTPGSTQRTRFVKVK